MGYNRDFKNTVAATVVGGLILSGVLWCVAHYSEILTDFYRALPSTDNPTLLVVGVVMLVLISLRKKLRPTLRSRIVGFRKRLITLFR